MRRVQVGEIILERMRRDRRVLADHPFRESIGLGSGDGSAVSVAGYRGGAATMRMQRIMRALAMSSL